MNNGGHALVYRSLLLWICSLAAIYLIVPGSIYAVHYLELSEIINPSSRRADIFLGAFNKRLFTPVSVGLLIGSGMLLTILLVWIGGSSIDSDRFVSNRFFWFTIASVSLLGIFIGTTGAFLNSPFSGAISIYLGNILVLHRDNPRSPRLILIFAYATGFLLAPYLISYSIDESLFIFEWSGDTRITLIRLVFSVLILVLTTLSAFVTAERVSQLEKPMRA